MGRKKPAWQGRLPALYILGSNVLQSVSSELAACLLRLLTT